MLGFLKENKLSYVQRALPVDKESVNFKFHLFQCQMSPIYEMLILDDFFVCEVAIDNFLGLELK